MSYLHTHAHQSSKASFTLIELLIVIAILVILAVVVILTLNPQELLAQARDSQRISDMATLKSALGLFLVDTAGKGFMGTSSIVYVSIPDTASSTCGDLGLPALSTGYSYKCSTTASSSLTDSTGWLPVNFNSVSSGSPLPKIPTDPTNVSSTGLYYTYATDGNGNFEITSHFESVKYTPVQANDGGSDNLLYEAGNKLTLSPLPRGNDAYTKSMLHFDGAGGSTAFTDDIGKTWTATGTAAISTTTAEFGQSGYFNGSAHIDTPQNNDFNVGSGDFTWDMWANFTSLGTYSILFDVGLANNNGGQLIFYQQHSGGDFLVFGYYNTSNILTNILTPNWLPTLNTWYHLAIVRYGNVFTLYVNGTSIGTATNAVTLPNPTTGATIGAQQSGAGVYSNYFNGYLDELRISKGIARWTTNFTPPISAYSM